MIKTWMTLCAFTVTLAFAGVADPTLYTSGAQEPDTPVMNINHVESDEPVFTVSIHPVSLLILSVVNIPNIYLTVEGNLGSSLALVTRPYLLWGSFDPNSRDDYDVLDMGLSEGLRFYFGHGHRGLYLDGLFKFEYVDMDYEHQYRTHSESGSVKAYGLGFGVNVGHKIRIGHFASSFDVGLYYMGFSVKGRDRDDVDEATGVGFGLDLNYTIGFAF